ncbi:IS3 family transposase [Pontibacter sp. HSC-14F20]|nr:IS3 family transposase [Pontibacter sp. HSC-14F20]
MSKRARENQRLLSLIKQEHQKSRQRYGSPRINEALKAKEVRVSRPRVARLMKQAQIKAKTVRRFRMGTDSRHSFAVSGNLLNRNFSPAAPGQAWVSDITYIRTLAGWLYLTVVLDLADRKVIGWALSETMRAKDTTVAALRMAISNRPVLGELIFHSDRGVQYACDEFRKELRAYPLIRQSMSRRANCWDNAVAESFFKSLKTEVVYGTRFIDQRVAAVEIFEYIEIFYNRERLHSSLGYRTPRQMEELLNCKPRAA